MKYFALEYPTVKIQGIPHESDTPYQDIQNTLKLSNSNATIYRIQYGDKEYIVVLGTSLDAKVAAKLKYYGTQAKLATLPQFILNQLLDRRIERIPHTQPLKEHKGYRYAESHMDETFTKFETEIAESNVPALQTGSKVKIQILPFIYVYEQLSEQETFHALIETIQKAGMSELLMHDNSYQSAREIAGINKLILRHAKKYRFTNSAMAMYHEVKQHTPSTLIDTRVSHWLEFEKTFDTPYNKDVQALYLVNSYPLKEMEQLAHSDKSILTRMHQVYAPYKSIISLVVIDARCKPHFDFSYDTSSNTWVYFASHMCPYGKCKYTRKASLSEHERYDVGSCIPCNECQAACTYYAEMVHTLLNMIRGDYSLTPDIPMFPEISETYTETVKTKVGKGKNQRTISQEKQRTIPFTLVTFDISVKKATPVSYEDIQPGEKRDNWLTLASSTDIIYERKLIKAYTRRYPTRKDGTRKEGDVRIKQDYYKYVPILRKERTRVVNVIASTYQEKQP